jgi:Domain of unknown function (DUF4404)
MSDHMEELRRSLHDAMASGNEEAAELLDRIEADDQGGGLVDRLNEAALRWEVSHPELSRIVTRVVDFLSAEGI